MRRLARVMDRLPNSIFVGPGNAKLWEMDPHFDRASECMLSIVDGYGVANVNTVEIMQTMGKCGTIHFEAVWPAGQ